MYPQRIYTIKEKITKYHNELYIYQLTIIFTEMNHRRK